MEMNSNEVQVKHRNMSVSIAGSVAGSIAGSIAASVEHTDHETAIARKPPGELVVLDPSGDTIIHVFAKANGENYRYLVSSNAVSLASPAFRSMVRNPQPSDANPFAGQLRSRTRQQGSQRAEYDYHTDHPRCVDMILRALHHQLEAGQSDASAEDLAIFALTCREFDCCKALNPWAELWAAQCSITAHHEVGRMFLVAHLMGSETIKMQAMKHVKDVPIRWMLEWGTDVRLQALPSTETFPILTKLHKIVMRLQNELHISIENMREAPAHPVISCRMCREPTDNVQEACCGAFEFQTRTCIPAERLDTYTSILSAYDLWPIADLDTSPNQLCDSILRALQRADYSCPDTTCPFDKEKIRFRRLIKGIKVGL